MDISVTEDQTTTTIHASGWLDAITAPELAEAIAGVKPSCEKLVINLAGLEYISSAGLRQLVAAHKMMSGNLEVTGVPADIMDILHMAGFDRRLHIV